MSGNCLHVPACEVLPLDTRFGEILCAFFVRTAVNLGEFCCTAGMLSWTGLYTPTSIRALFFVSRLLGVVHAVGGFQKKKKKKTEYERVHLFWYD